MLGETPYHATHVATGVACNDAALSAVGSTVAQFYTSEEVQDELRHLRAPSELPDIYIVELDKQTFSRLKLVRVDMGYKGKYWVIILDVTTADVAATDRLQRMLEEVPSLTKLEAQQIVLPVQCD